MPNPVIIVGAGPTGLSLSLLLARAGIRSVLCERNAAPQAHPAACILDTRTMEIFREIGVADRVLRESQDIVERARVTWVTTLAGRELGSFSVLPDDVDALLALSPVHATSFPQNRLEPILWAKVRDEPLITFLPAHECVGVTESGGEVVVTLKKDGQVSTISGSYGVVCEGASGTVRRGLGIAMDGRVLQTMIGIYFTADLAKLVSHRKSILYWILNPDALGVLIAHWLPEEWVLFAPYFPPQQSPEEFTAARCRALVAAALGFAPDDLAIRLVRSWVLSANLARQYRRGRVFLAGDAAHAFPPTGGLGLNTGVQDAHNLAWKLAAVIGGRAGAALLDSYEAERRPVASANLDHSVANYERMSDLTAIAGLSFRHLRLLQAIQNSAVVRSLPQGWQQRALNAVLRVAFGRLAVFAQDGTAGAAARDSFTKAIGSQIAHYRFLGLDLGFTYDAGAFIADGTAKPRANDPVVDYRPTTWPSARLPHFRVEEAGVQKSIHDFLAADRFLLLTDAAGAGLWKAAAAAIGEPLAGQLRCVAIGNGREPDVGDPGGAWPTLSEVGPGGAVLVRPDGHVAWRSHALPEAPGEALTAVLSEVLRRR